MGTPDTTSSDTTADEASRDRSRAERLAHILERDGAHCVWCRRAIDTDLVRATTEHVVPRIKGGPSWIENEVAACARCNRQRGHRTPAEWLDECERRGWDPDAAAVVRALRALDAAIAERGGQRRARPYVRSQLRRLARDAHMGPTESRPPESRPTESRPTGTRSDDRLRSG